jgi:tetratricopeptide (TPR) repeat protein
MQATLLLSVYLLVPQVLAVQHATSKNVMYFLDRAQTYSDQKQHQLALQAIDVVLWLDPKYAEAYYRRGGIKLIDNHYFMAIFDFDVSLRLDPHHYKALSARGLCSLNLSEIEKARSDFDASILENAKWYESYLGRGILGMKQGDYSKAIADLEMAYQLNPEDVQVLTMLAFVKSSSPVKALRDGSKAALYASKACQLTKYQDSTVLIMSADAYAENGQFEQAVELLETAIKIDDIRASTLENVKRAVEKYKNRQKP